MLLVHKIEIKANKKQQSYFAKSCGVARFAYNWALANWKKQYEAGLKPNEAKLRKTLNAIKQDEFPWMLEVTKVAPQQAIKNLGQAFQRFFKQQGSYPRFKKKGIHDAFRADNGPSCVGADAVKMDDKLMQIPRLGWIRLKERLRYTGQIKSVVISRRADKWFAAISVETETLPHVRKNNGTVGVDVGIKHLATLSTGEVIANPKAHTGLLKQLRRASRSLSRRKRGGHNYTLAKRKLARLHVRISNIRENNLHQLTTALVLNHSAIAIEDLNVSGMVKNRKLSRHIIDCSFYEFRRQLTYKSRWYGTTITVADRYFPSSKRCHACHDIKGDLCLSDRHWRCANCGMHHDRDMNAAKNLHQLINSTASSAGIDACGEPSTGKVA